MIETIQKKLLDLLEADERLLQGGNAFEEGWTGVVRVEEDSDLVKTGSDIKLYDHVFDENGSEGRPGIWLGMRGLEAEDREGFESCDGSESPTEARVLLQPLVIVVIGSNLAVAKARRNQLLQNVRSILGKRSNRIVADHWYWLSMRGKVKTTSSGTGGNGPLVEARAVLPIELQYYWTPESPA